MFYLETLTIIFTGHEEEGAFQNEMHTLFTCNWVVNERS